MKKMKKNTKMIYERPIEDMYIRIGTGVLDLFF